MMNKGCPVGIGCDLASVSEIERLDRDTSGAFVRSTFSARERAEADTSDIYAYYAGRFAAKEAVFKAIAPLLGNEKFDFRIVETLRRADGSPYVFVSDELRTVMERAGVEKIMVSISKDGGFALAFAEAVN